MPKATRKDSIVRLWKAERFLRAFRGKLEPALDLFCRKFAQVFVDDIANMFEVYGEGNNLHRPPPLEIVEAAAGP